MKLSSRSRYGFRAIMELALYYGKGPLQIKTIAKKEDISNKYIEQLVAMLKINGLVESLRGCNGGYILAQDPSEIKLSNIFSAIEGPMPTVDCTKHDKFTTGCTDCIVRSVWSKVHNTT